MKIRITNTHAVVYATSLFSILLFLSCVFQKDNKYEEKSNAIIKTFTASFIQRYGDQCTLYYESLIPSNSVEHYLSIYEDFVTLDPPNLIQRTLSKYINSSTLDSIRLVERNNNWQKVLWDVKGIKLSSKKNQNLDDGQVALFISSVLFNPTYNRAVIYVEIHKKSSTVGSLYSFILDDEEWIGSPYLPVYSAG